MRKLVIFVIVIILISSAVYYVSHNISQEWLAGGNNRKTEKDPQILRIHSFLQQINASTEGIVAEKNDEYFILSDDKGNQLKLFYEPRGLTSFSDLKDLSKDIPYSDIKVGDRLKGGISIIVSKENAVGKTGNRKLGDMIAHRFIRS